nr:uncharacterized protein LOC115266745 [Aedes albopictus]
MAYELFSFLNIPFMDAKTFMKDEMAMDAVLDSALEESLDKAVRAEKDIIFEEKRSQGLEVAENEPVNMSAALDGSWGQRSNGHRYNSASGCAAIIGMRSKKVCFVGCRNKRCTACDRGQGQDNHKCYKNFKGASCGMEPDVIIEGFQKLYEKKVKVTTVVTDGDSTTVAKLKNGCKYGHEIRQQLCCNHVLKNTGKKLREIKCPKHVSETVSKCIERITKGIRCAVVHCADKTGGKDVKGLRQDIRNAPYHVFGSHKNCRDYFCDGREEDSESLIPELQKLGVWSKIMVVIEKLAAKAEFINENQTSNLYV